MCYINYFYKDLDIKEVNIEITPEFYIYQRKHRSLIPKSFKLKKILIGDILEFVYFFKTSPLVFSGICIAIKRKSFVVSDLVIILRNIVLKTGVELTFSYFYNRAYKAKFLDYKRKFYNFNKNKLYFIRYRMNRESRVS